MSTLKLGIIGYSEGNGHPYSWSAIFNGYDPKFMENCIFPSIPRYLAKQQWPEDRLSEAVVTHIWTQDITLSKHIASACYISTVVEKPEDMIGFIDGLLLARDDSENNYFLAQPFLEAGLPVYFDKPISLSVTGLENIYSMERYAGQIFTCSALSYATELNISKEKRNSLGEIREVHAIAPKDWDRYSIHVIEPLLRVCEDIGNVASHNIYEAHDGRRVLTINWDSNITTRIFSMGYLVKSPFSLLVMGGDGYEELKFVDSFNAFRNALRDFVLGIINKDVRTDKQFVHKAISIVELGRK